MHLYRAKHTFLPNLIIMNIKTLALAKKLISIPSYVDKKNNETKSCEFIYEFIKANTSFENVVKQPVKDGRFNVYAYSGKPKVLFCGHIDTVQPQSAWKTNPTTPVLRNGKLYGLGASDMKASLAALVAALAETNGLTDMGLLVYIDEEYDFLGMKAFIGEYKEKIKPQLIVSADGSMKQIGTMCRGLIELKCTVSGKSGHAAMGSGVNAIDSSYKALRDLKMYLKTQKDPDLGNTAMNIAYITGGLNKGTAGDKKILGKEGNMIADYCEFIIDIRAATIKVTPESIISIIKKALKNEGAKLEDVKVRHDFGAWVTRKKEVPKFLQQYEFSDPSKSGYGDAQMLWEAFEKVPTIDFGIAGENMPHKPNEYVYIKDLPEAKQFFSDIISRYNK